MNIDDIDEDIDLDLYVNLDSPDVEHINIYNSQTEEQERCIKITSLDFNGEPVHCIYNLQSLRYLLDSLSYSEQSISEVFADGGD